MSRAFASRLSRTFPVSFSHQGARHFRAVRAPRSVVRLMTQRSLATDESDKQGHFDGSPPTPAASEGEVTAKGSTDDVAARRKTELLKRYGNRTASSEPIAVKREESAREAAGVAAEDANKSAADEADHNQIWGDYVRYMEHQRKKGWKT